MYVVQTTRHSVNNVRALETLFENGHYILQIEKSITIKQYDMNTNFFLSEHYNILIKKI